MTFCDADTDGGGWALIGSFVNTDGRTSWTGHDGRGGLPGSLGVDLTAWWNFDEPHGSDPLRASFAHIDSTQLLTGTPVRGSAVTVVPGISGNARHFSGSPGSCIAISTSPPRVVRLASQSGRAILAAKPR